MKKLILPLLLILGLALARTAVPVQPNRALEIKIHNINQVEMCVSNYGKFGQTEGGEAGCWWPNGSGHGYIFGAGPWFGTIIDDDTLVTIGYGPHGGETEYVPGLGGMSQSAAEAVLYMYPTLWPPPEVSFPMAPQSNKSHQDSWCTYNDLDENAHVPGDTRPIGLEVYQTVYAWNLSTTADIIFIRYELKNITAQTEAGEQTLTNIFFGVATDNDIGNESGTGNDIISGIVSQEYIIDGDTILVDNLGYQWQNDMESTPAPPWWPGAIGFDYLQSPWDLVENEDKDNDTIPDQFERDSSYYVNNLPPYKWDVDLDGTPDWRDPSEIPQLGMTAFKRFTLNLEPNLDNERYVTLAGYNFKTMVYEPYDTVQPLPDDQRFLQCSGPFELMSESTAVVLVGVIFANWDSLQERPDSALALVDGTCQFVFDMNWLLPGPPTPPILTCIPGDAQITLVWSNAPEYEPDPYYDVVSDPGNPNLYDPYYRQYDFEGYRIWRSQTGQSGSWERLEVCDLYNGITFEWIAADGSDTLRAEDTGIIHSFIDDGVRNGFTYYYAVTSFDYNWVTSTYDSIFIMDSVWYAPETIWVYIYDTLEVTGPRALSFESGAVGIQSAPRRDPANFVPGICSLEVISGNELLGDKIVLDIPYPLAMTSSDMYLDYLDVVYDSATQGGLYSVYLRDTDGSNVDSLFAVVGNNDITITHAFSMLHGVTVEANLVFDSIPADESIFKEIKQESGTYPESLIVASIPSAWTNYFAFWAYRGNEYQIEWYSKTGGSDANSVRVIDLMTGDTIPYRPYDPETDHSYDEFANGWCFLSHRDVSDTLVLNGSPWTLYNTKYLYINSGLVGMNRNGPMLPTGPVPSTSDVWLAVASEEFTPAPLSASFTIHSTPAYFDTVTQLEAFNVKVVPNPYLLHNEWQTSFKQRRLKFINLPSDCTIRIFNLNGELVKTLLHHHTLEPIEGQQEVTNSAGGDQWWDLLSENRQLVSSGIYIFHIQSAVGEQVGKFVVIR